MTQGVLLIKTYWLTHAYSQFAGVNTHYDRAKQVHLPIELILVGGPPMLEGALCFPEPAWPSLVAPAAAAGTCGEVGGELGDLLSDALGLADRFSGCAPSLSCKNQNSTVSPAVTTLEIWVARGTREESPPSAAAIEVWTQTNSTEAHAQQFDGKPGGTGDKVHATARISSSLAKRLTAHSKRKADIFGCKPLTFTCKIPDISSQTWAESCICVHTSHAFMRFNARPPCGPKKPPNYSRR